MSNSDKAGQTFESDIANSKRMGRMFRDGQDESSGFERPKDVSDRLEAIEEHAEARTDDHRLPSELDEIGKRVTKYYEDLPEDAPASPEEPVFKHMLKHDGNNSAKPENEEI